ncbi:LytTR family DNA-binding domain-containing protein [Chryseolinea sp. T2]|uniref:LytR/AlgR family response regulator transcription factor n=1 Tax=Chryseolinea sp. T2 TaxID=3129255 RepID=UPI003077BB54
MRCLIVDDEPLARQLLESYVGRIAELSLVASCGSAMDAFDVLQTHSLDLLFLDINLPNTNGIELLKSLQQRPRVIFTTAYREYAFEAYDLDVIDYLLKPISFDRFLRAIGKIRQLKKYQPIEQNQNMPSAYDEAFLYLKENREQVKVFLKDILYIESLRDYVRVKTASREVVTYQKISYLEQRLPQNKFIRVHRSFIVSIDHVVSFTNSQVKVSDYTVPIGRNYRTFALAGFMSQPHRA